MTVAPGPCDSETWHGHQETGRAWVLPQFTRHLIVSRERWESPLGSTRPLVPILPNSSPFQPQVFSAVLPLQVPEA